MLVFSDHYFIFLLYWQGKSTGGRECIAWEVGVTLMTVWAKLISVGDIIVLTYWDGSCVWYLKRDDSIQYDRQYSPEASNLILITPNWTRDISISIPNTRHWPACNTSSIDRCLLSEWRHIMDVSSVGVIYSSVYYKIKMSFLLGNLWTYVSL